MKAVGYPGMKGFNPANARFLFTPENDERSNRSVRREILGAQHNGQLPADERGVLAAAPLRGRSRGLGVRSGAHGKSENPGFMGFFATPGRLVFWAVILVFAKGNSSSSQH